ncbi:MAG: c-type cytochrome [Aestuariivirga sp.]
MMRACFPALSFVLLTLVASPAFAADAATGYTIAKENCARCHNVEKGGGFKQRPPTFQAIAIYRTQDDIWGRIISPSPHSGMPDVSWTLTPDNVQDVVAYIVSLDRPVSLPE